MKRLEDSALLFGRLLPVDEPHLVTRYNRALCAFGLPPTALAGFRVDMTGFSPEVAEELGDRDYLDPGGVNRRFIILTPEQERLPVVHTRFSNTAALMHAFFAANARAINALTIKDVLYGEIEDSVSAVGDIEDLLSINEVTFRVLSAEEMLAKAGELRRLVDRLKTVPDAWRDDAMLERMVALAGQTGDIRRNALVPERLTFRHAAYWTSHFGGVFVFIDGRNATVISDPDAPGFRRSRPWQVSYVGRDDHARIFDFLLRTGRIELPRASWIERSGFIDHRIDMLLTTLIHRFGPEADLDRRDGIWLQTWLHRNADRLVEEGTYPFLREMQRRIAADGQVAMREIRPDRRFLLVRAQPDHRDRWLTNRLIAGLVPFDFVSRFIFDKQGFYADYERCDERLRAHIAKRLGETYLADKAAMRLTLFGLRGTTVDA